jgi:anti-sigma factor RsiW
MTHPEELLAGYVNGTLTDPERAAVDAHLPTCERCREELDLASRAVAALETLEEVPVPFGVTGPVLAEGGRRLEKRGAKAQRYQWIAGLAAAAAIVAVIAINIGSSGDGDRERAAPAAAAGGGAAGGGASGKVKLEVQSGVNYRGAEGVRALAEGAARSYASEAAAPVPSATSEAMDATVGGAQERFANAAPALRCLSTAGVPLHDPANQLVRLVEAKYSGTPAYFAVFLGGPGAGQPPERVVIWAISKDTCTLLNGTSLNF